MNRRISQILLLFISVLGVGLFLVRQKQHIKVKVYDPGRVSPGYTLFAGTSPKSRVLLFDTDGRILKEWQLSASANCMNLLPDGHLFGIQSDYNLFEFDWQGKPQKSPIRLINEIEEYNFNHEVIRLPNGHHIGISLTRPTVHRHIYPDKPVANNWILEIDQNSEVVWRWNVNDHYKDLEKLAKISFPTKTCSPKYLEEQGYCHWAFPNSLHVISKNRLGEKDKRFKPGNLLISFRNSSTIAVVDKGSSKIVWAWGPGEIDNQHHVTLLENGHLLFIDNGKYRGTSRILELEPVSKKIVWEYRPLEFIREGGSAQRLPNGNTLITTITGILEVTPDKQVVWEYRSLPKPIADKMTPKEFEKAMDRYEASLPIYRTYRYPPEYIEKFL